MVEEWWAGRDPGLATGHGPGATRGGAGTSPEAPVAVLAAGGDAEHLKVLPEPLGRGVFHRVHAQGAGRRDIVC